MTEPAMVQLLTAKDSSNSSPATGKEALKSDWHMLIADKEGELRRNGHILYSIIY